jgi:hypothetical protein
VTLVSGEEYAGPACCVRRQLLRVGSTCPMHVVIDDRNGSGTEAGWQTALHECGFNRTYSLTSLIASVLSTSAPRHGRRLLHGGMAGVAATSAKLWLWALPLELVAFMDVDVFVAKDIDELLLKGLDSAFGAVSSCSTSKSRWINGGVLLFRPSMLVVTRLTRYARPSPV